MISAIKPAATSERELTTDELGHVSGGSFGIRDIVTDEWVRALAAPPPPPPTGSGWFLGW